MSHFKIREPIWKNRSVGLAENKLDTTNTVEILYKDRSGNRVFPGTYTITKGLAMFAQTMVVKGTKVRVVPIDQLTKEQ